MFSFGVTEHGSLRVPRGLFGSAVRREVLSVLQVALPQRRHLRDAPGIARLRVQMRPRLFGTAVRNAQQRL